MLPACANPPPHWLFPPLPARQHCLCGTQDALEARAKAAEQQVKEANSAVEKERTATTTAVVRDLPHRSSSPSNPLPCALVAPGCTHLSAVRSHVVG